MLYATPEKVFDALTKEAILEEWCDGGGKVASKAGGEIEMFGGWVKGEVVEFSAKTKKLSYTWKPKEWDKKTPASLVAYTFNTHKAGTDLHVVHTGFPTQEEADNHLRGWTDFVFEPLNDYFTAQM